MSEGCPFCNNEFSHTVIRSYEHWKVQLYLNQCYLGRCVVKLDRHEVDLFNLEKDERRELFETVVPELKAAIDGLFEPDMYNYASLGNDARHLHLHLIPRYRQGRSFAGEEFIDERWGSHYKPYPADFEVSEDVLERIRGSIERKMR